MKQKRPFWASFILFFLCCTAFTAQSADSSLLSTRQKWTIAGMSTAYAGGFYGLYQLWYADYNTGKFHFFNDQNEWAQMDKVGHLYSAYAEAKYASRLFEWSGFEKKDAALLGCGYSLLFQTTIEVFDGFSDGWGASTGDLAANLVGTGGYLVQDVFWEEQRILVKYSYRNSPYAAYRPELLGNNLQERMFKDYNGQTYWLSANISSFASGSSAIPKWLNLSFGYGIDGFIAGTPEDQLANIPKNVEYFPRMRLFYLSPDIDLTKIEVKNKALKTTLSILNNIKIPLPAVRFSESGKVDFVAFGF